MDHEFSTVLKNDVHLAEDPATSEKGLGHGRQWPRDPPGRGMWRGRPGRPMMSWKVTEMLGKPIDFPIQYPIGSMYAIYGI